MDEKGGSGSGGSAGSGGRARAQAKRRAEFDDAPTNPDSLLVLGALQAAIPMGMEVSQVDCEQSLQFEYDKAGSVAAGFRIGSRGGAFV